MKTLTLLMFVLALFASSLKAQVVEIWPLTYYGIVSHQYQDGFGNWTIDSQDIEELSTMGTPPVSSLKLTHAVNFPYTSWKNSIRIETVTYHHRVGPFIWLATYQEVIGTYPPAPGTHGEQTTRVLSSAFLDPAPLVFWQPSRSGYHLDTDGFNRTISYGSGVPCSVKNIGSQALWTKIPCWWGPEDTNPPFWIDPITYRNFEIFTQPGETKQIFISPAPFSTLLVPLNFMNFSIDDATTEPWIQ